MRAPSPTTRGATLIVLYLAAHPGPVGSWPRKIGREHVLIVEMPGRYTRPGRFKPGSAARSGEAACPTDLDGFRLISLSPARSADRAWRPVDSVRVAEGIIRTYERRDAVGMAAGSPPLAGQSRSRAGSAWCSS